MINIKNYHYLLIFGLIGLLISFIIFSAFMFLIAYEAYENQKLDYYRFNLCKPCGTPPNLDCVIKICEEEASRLYYVPNYANPNLTLDEFKKAFCLREYTVQKGISGPKEIKIESSKEIINSFCGYNRWRGYGYGTKPNFIKTFFSWHIIHESFEGVGMFGPFGLLALILPPLIGIIIGITLDIKRKRSTF